MNGSRKLATWYVAYPLTDYWRVWASVYFWTVRLSLIYRKVYHTDGRLRCHRSYTSFPVYWRLFALSMSILLRGLQWTYPKKSARSSLRTRSTNQKRKTLQRTPKSRSVERGITSHSNMPLFPEDE